MFTMEFLAENLKDLFTSVADALAVSTGFCRRKRKLLGSTFAQALVFAWLTAPAARGADFAAAAALVGCPVTPQAVAKRFSPASVAFFQALLAAAVRLAVTAQPLPPPLLARFSAVDLLDCTTLSLPAALADTWPGSGSRGQPVAGLKVALLYDLAGQRVVHLGLAPGRGHDRAAAPPPQAVPRGGLRLADLGFFNLTAMADLAAGGAYFLSRLQAGCRLWYRGRCWTQPALLAAHGPQRAGQPSALVVALGKRAQLPARLILERVPPEVAALRRARLLAEASEKGQVPSPERLALCAWTLLVTNAPGRLLRPAEALVLYRARWQIELVFKLWKREGGLGASRSRQPQRVLTEHLAKLCALLVAHWLALVAGPPAADLSRVKVHHQLQKLGYLFLKDLADPQRLVEDFAALARCLSAGCRLDPRRKHPSTYQCLGAVAAPP